jgi:hypothetical protein
LLNEYPPDSDDEMSSSWQQEEEEVSSEEDSDSSDEQLNTKSVLNRTATKGMCAPIRKCEPRFSILKTSNEAIGMKSFINSR